MWGKKTVAEQRFMDLANQLWHEIPRTEPVMMPVFPPQLQQAASTD